MSTKSHISLDDERFAQILDFLEQLSDGNIDQKLEHSKKSNGLDGIVKGLNMVLEEIRVRYIKESKIEARINEVLNVLLSFAQGDFRARLKVDNNYSLFDGLASGVNILGEQLEDSRRQITESERSKLSLISNIPGVVYRCKHDENWTPTFMSAECISLTGYTSEELMETGFAAIVHPDDLARIGREIDESIELKKSFELEYRIITKDGTIKHVWEKGNRVLGEEAEVLAIEGLIIDITEKKRAKDKLLLTRNQLRQVIDNNPAVIYISKASGDFQALFISENIKEQFGYEAKEFLSDPELWLNNIHPDDRLKVHEELKGLFETTDNHSLEYRLRHKNGDYLWIHDDYRLERDEHGNPKRIVGLWIDITKRKDSEFREKIVNNISRELSENRSTIEFLEFVRQELNKVFPADNYYVRSFSSTRNELKNIYSVVDAKPVVGPPKSRTNGNGLSEYIIKNKKPLRLSGSEVLHFWEKYGLKIYGEKAKSWLGVPLMQEKQAVGVIAVQSYTHSDIFSAKDEKLLAFVGTQIGAFIARNEVQKSLFESEQKYRSLFEKMVGGLMLSTEGGTIEMVNPQLLQMLGYNEKELIGHNVYELLIDKKERKRLRGKIELRKQGISESYETKFIHKSGNQLWVQINVSPNYSSKGTFNGTMAMITDITRRKESEEQQKSFFNAFDQSKNEIYMFDAKSLKFNYVNQGARENLGYTMGEMKKLTPLDLKEQFTEFEFKEMINPLLQKTKTWILFEASHRRKDGSFYPVEVNLQLTKFLGRPVFMAVILDITERKETERLREEFTMELEQKVEERTSELENTKKELELSLEKEKELGELKSRFVSTASHQFRTPMTIIQSNSELLGILTENSPSSVKNKLERATGKIIHEIQVMTTLMDEILILGKITSGAMTIHYELTDVLELCNDLVERFNSIQQDGRIIDFELRGVPQEVVLDLKLIDHAISNLLSNAFKYSEKKNPKLQLFYEEQELTIMVSDYGMGIPKNEISNLFQPFHRAPNVRDIEGTGLGLAIAKEYVELNNGKISVESKLNEGTIFTLNLPLDNSKL